MTGRDNKLERAEALLESLRLSQRSIERQSTASLAIGALAVIWLSCAIVEAIFQFGQPLRLLLFIVALALSLTSLVLLYLKLARDVRLEPGLNSQTYWALQLGELASPALRDRLLNALQIVSPNSGHRDQPSLELAQDALYRAVADVENVETARALSTSDRTRSVRIGGVLVLTFLVAIVVSPKGVGGGLERLLHPSTDYAPPAPFSLSIEHSSGWAYRGEPVEFQITASGKPPRNGSFYYRQEGGEEVGQLIDLRNGSTKVEYPGFPADINYGIRADNVTSPEYKLTVIARPQIVELSYQLSPPAYSRLPAFHGRENVGDIESLPGGRVELDITASKKLGTASLVMTRPGRETVEIDTLKMDVSDNHARIAFTVRHAATYTIRLRDRDGHEDREPVTYSIQTLADEFPAVRILYPEGDVVLGDDMIVPLSIEADDDFGVARMELNYHNLNGDSLLETVALPPTRGVPNLTIDTLWSIGHLPLMPGDVLEYWVSAWDNDNINGPKRSESTRRLVRLPTFEEIVAGVEQTEAEAEIDAKKTLEAAKELKEEVARLVEEMRRDPNANWERQKQIEEAMKSQEQVSKQAEQMSQALDELVEKLEKHNMLTPETLEKYMELQKLMDEVASPELREAMEKLKQAMETEDPEKIRQALEKFDMDREEFMKSIERSLAILQQLKLERKLDELARRAEELLHNQEEILKDIAGNQNEEAVPSLDVQKAGVERLKAEMAETAKMASEAEKQEIAADLNALGEQLAQMNLQQGMDQTKQAVQAGNKSGAKSSGEDSARKLAEMASSLAKLSEQFKEQNKADLERKIRRLVEELIFVSQDQEGVMTQSRALGTDSPRYRLLAGAQQDVKQGLEGIARRMLDLSKETFFVTPELGASLGKALQQMEKSLVSFSDRLPRSAAQPQKQALGEINSSAAQLLAILNQLEGSSSSSGYEEMMQKLAEMASQQQGLNQQSNSMPMPGAGKPGQMPGEGQGQMPGSSPTLSQMAAQQRALQQQMEQAAEEARGIEDMLGDLEGIANSMGEVAKDMENKVIGERTRRLQEQIVSRLLDATRSAREEEYSKKRESKAGVDFGRRSPSPLQLENERDRLRQDLLKALREGYSPDYRRLIRDYYNALDQDILKK